MNPTACGKVLLLVEAEQHLHSDDSHSKLAYDVVLTERSLVLLHHTDGDLQIFSLADVTCFLSRDADDVILIHVTDQNLSSAKKVWDAVNSTIIKSTFLSNVFRIFFSG